MVKSTKFDGISSQFKSLSNNLIDVEMKKNHQRISDGKIDEAIEVLKSNKII